MNSGAYNFTLSQGRLILLTLCLVVSGILLFGAGVVTAFLFEKPAPAWQAPHTDLPSAIPEKTSPATQPRAEHTPEAAAKGPVQNGLLVEVASFHDKVRADSLADALKRQGFAPVSVSAVAVEQERWHVVRIGPYKDWDSASRASAEIDRAYSLRTRLMATKGSTAN
jgi:cell division septation protein DedD